MSSATLPPGFSSRIVPRPAVRLAGIRIRTSMETAREDIEKLRDNALPQISRFIAGKQDTAAYGVSWVTDAGTCSFDYCLACRRNRDSALPGRFEEIVIPAGLYAECTLPSREALYSLYDYLYHKWLPEQEESIGIGDTPCYEVYPDHGLKEGQMKLYIPIVSA
ncbi:MAG: GyrI-like domain-containing protein [Oxalobacter formigenes]|nr:GyrI-like domain-containing protein [Oxalobacter formigenes]